METLVLNLFGGPGTGKSTTAAGVFAELKSRGILCEIATEYAKDLVWSRSDHLLANQIYVFGEQHHRITRLEGQVPIIITDAPLLHSIIYDRGENPYFRPMVLAEHKKLHNLNVFLERIKEFEPQGRVHNEEQARGIDKEIYDMLAWLKGEAGDDLFSTFPAGKDSFPLIADEAWKCWVELNTKNGTPVSERAAKIIEKQRSR